MRRFLRVTPSLNPIMPLTSKVKISNHPSFRRRILKLLIAEREEDPRRTLRRRTTKLSTGALWKK